MAARKKATKKDKDEKTVDLPPKGPRNADPLTDAPGAHPIETGIGAALGGAAAGLAVGAVGGPVGAVIGATVGGAVAGGLAGKGVGELIDPTVEDTWLREYFGTRTHRPAHETHEHYRPAYRYGLHSARRHHGKRFEEVETDLRSGWVEARGTSTMTWDEARDAARHAFDRVGTSGATCPTPAGTVTTRDTAASRREEGTPGTGTTAGAKRGDRGHKA